MKNIFYIFIFIAFSAAMTAQNQFSRENNQNGINVFEPSKADATEFDGFKVKIGGAFTQGFQMLSHENVDTSAKKVNALYKLGSGFNLAAANLNFDVQLADGVRMYLENYMAARHHNEFWVKGGYIQMDKLPMLGNPEWFSKYMRVKIGHMEVNYGDSHFRRSDGGNTIFNPFVENNIVDAFATEIGGELYIFPTSDFMVMVGLTNGLIRNDIYDYSTNPEGSVQKKNPAMLAKVAYDKNFNEDLRFRLSASLYTNSETPRSTIYSGDRTGSNYFGVLENAAYTNGTSPFTSGRFSPGTYNSITAFMINPFVKFKGLEFFADYEIISGKAIAETDNRKTTQMGAELVYRFLANEQMYVGAKYNAVTSRLSGYTTDVDVNRMAFSAGWFPTKNLLLKGEYVTQEYDGFKGTDIRNGGKFSGLIVQAVVGF